jgi:hypothetical protein
MILKMNRACLKAKLRVFNCLIKFDGEENDENDFENGCCIYLNVGCRFMSG